MRIDRVKLIAEMARAEISCEKLAREMGVSRATVGAIRGGKSCREDTAEKMAAALGVPLGELLERRGNVHG